MGSSLHLYLLALMCCFLDLIILTTNSSSSAQPLCHEDESLSLLQFKQSFIITEHASGEPFAYPKVESWKLDGNSSGDCCSWDGVECDHDTGHVIGLDLTSSFLYGSLNSSSSLFDLIHLRRLNLADNDFNYSQIPPRIGHLSRLTSLNLSYSAFSGQIPLEISHLSKLAFLDLSRNLGVFQSENTRYSESLLKLEKPNLRDLVQNLTNLKVLDLTQVHISSTLTGAFLSSNLSSLTALGLDSCGLYGEFPAGIFRLPNLQILSVRFNENLTGFLPEFHGGSPLKKLALEGTSFSGVLPDSIGNLKSLNSLELRGCNFSGTLPSSLGNLAQLITLDLSVNYFSGQIPSSIANISQLTFLWLGDNYFVGTLPLSFGKLSKLTSLFTRGMKMRSGIPQSLANLTQLSFLSMSSNELIGQIPSWLMNLTHLTGLGLSDNQLHGMIPSSIFQLHHLESLNLDRNNLIGKVELDNFLKLRNLTQFQLSANKLTVLTKTNTNSTFPKLYILRLASCNLRKFPNFLRFQDELVVLDLLDNKIHGQIPTWLWNTTKETMQLVDLSHNFLTGFEQHQNVIPWRSVRVLDLSFNMLQGSLPIPPPATVIYKVTHNLLSGEIQPSICHNSSLGTLDLSYNNISGTIPPCLASSVDSMLVLNLSCNNFQGTIPDTFKTGIKLMMIDLSQNQLHGQVPRSLANCTKLEILVLGNNQIEGTFPFWLGALPELQVLVLRSNKFHGTIANPKANLKFPQLRIIDLSHNSFSGNLLSEYFQNLNSMKKVEIEKLTYMQAIPGVEVVTPATPSGDHGTRWVLQQNYMYSITMANKGTQRLYEKIQNAFIAVDLSSNKFEGEIPESIGSLSGLQGLNLSNNNFTSVIPSSLANLRELESLDLSRNLLSGEIPQQLTQLTFLAVLNVSHNHLAGPIPRGKQFDTFENNSYDENLGLCGAPLSKLCGNSETSPPPPPPQVNSQDVNSEFSCSVYYIIIAMGYGSGLIVGLVFGHTMTTRYHLWFVGTFGRREQIKKREKQKGRRKLTQQDASIVHQC